MNYIMNIAILSILALNTLYVTLIYYAMDRKPKVFGKAYKNAKAIGRPITTITSPSAIKQKENAIKSITT